MKMPTDSPNACSMCSSLLVCALLGSYASFVTMGSTFNATTCRVQDMQFDSCPSNADLSVQRRVPKCKWTSIVMIGGRLPMPQLWQLAGCLLGSQALRGARSCRTAVAPYNILVTVILYAVILRLYDVSLHNPTSFRHHGSKKPNRQVV